MREKKKVELALSRILLKAKKLEDTTVKQCQEEKTERLRLQDEQATLQMK